MKEGNIKFQFLLRKGMEHFPRKIIRPPYESIMRASYGSRNKGATSSYSNIGDLKMISIHPDFVEVIRDPFCKNEIFEFIPRSVVIENHYAKFLRDYKCLIEELDKDDKT